VAAWLSFYSWTVDNVNEEEAQKLLPDSTLVPKSVWQIIRNRQKKFNKEKVQSGFPLGYFKGGCVKSICGKDSLFHNDYLYDICPFYNYPITGVSYEQATKYCAWQTSVRGNGKVLYRLPTQKEWILIAKTSIGKKELDSVCLTHKCSLYNYKKVMPRLYPVAYFMRQGSYYDLLGNVSEMVEEEHISMGGNYQLNANSCNMLTSQYYASAQSWLGFRIIGIIRK
jgi:hypothetical protein